MKTITSLPKAHKRFNEVAAFLISSGRSGRERSSRRDQELAKHR